MSTATLTSKGQMTVPKDVRERLGLRPGDRVEFITHADGRVYLAPATVSLASLAGILPKPKRPVTVKEMKEAIRNAVADKYRRR